MTKVRVGIVSWNSASVLAPCLAALPAALGGLDADVVVVDNASTDASAAVAAGYDGVRVIVNTANVGYAKAMNQALDGGDDVLIALNPDTVAPPQTLATLVERLLAEPDLALVVPHLVKPDGGHQPSVHRFPSASVALASSLPLPMQQGQLGARLWLEAHGRGRYEHSADIDWAIGAVHVMRATALGGAPPYSERWFMYGEDIELCWRLAKAGWRRRLVADVSILHVGNTAGALAWGPARDRRWLPITYDFYKQAHGSWAARGWALANAVGVIVFGVRQTLLSFVFPQQRRARFSDARAQLRVLPIHARAALLGPPPPDSKPPREPR